MQNLARYYLGRVHKVGNLNEARLVDAIVGAVSVERVNFNFTLTDVQKFGDGKEPEFIFGRLAKYRPRTEIDVVRPEEHKEAVANVTNMIDASSPFVYISRFSGIAYQHISGRLEKETFERAFPEIITRKYQDFFVSCAIEPITDLRTFVIRLSKLEKIRRLHATVRPPNPLFGPCWASLKEYLKSRNLEEMSVKEEAQQQAGIKTDLQEIVDGMLRSEGKNEEVVKALSKNPPAVGDAALLMAADGYGKGRIDGVEGDKSVTIYTRDNQKHFSFAKEPTPRELYEAAVRELETINEERYLDH